MSKPAKTVRLKVSFEVDMRPDAGESMAGVRGWARFMLLGSQFKRLRVERVEKKRGKR